LETIGILQCVVTQNVDDLHRRAGQQSLAEIHGNMRLIRCTRCGSRWPREEISVAVLPPICARCGGILKGDTVSFGQPIPEDVLARCQEEAAQADCILVAGTSATVYPAASLPYSVLERGGTVIEVNPHASELTPFATIVVEGPAGSILPRLAAAVRSLRAGAARRSRPQASAAAPGSGGAEEGLDAARPHLELARAVVAEDPQVHGLTAAMLPQTLEELAPLAHLGAIDREHQIAGLEASLSGRAAGDDAGDDDVPAQGVAG